MCSSFYQFNIQASDINLNFTDKWLMIEPYKRDPQHYTEDGWILNVNKNLKTRLIELKLVKNFLFGMFLVTVTIVVTIINQNIIVGVPYPTYNEVSHLWWQIAVKYVLLSHCSIVPNDIKNITVKKLPIKTWQIECCITWSC